MKSGPVVSSQPAKSPNHQITKTEKTGYLCYFPQIPTICKDALNRLLEPCTLHQDSELLPHELSYLSTWNNRPLGVSHVWTWILQQSGMHPQLHVSQCKCAQMAGIRKVITSFGRGGSSLGGFTEVFWQFQSIWDCFKSWTDQTCAVRLLKQCWTVGNGSLECRRTFMLLQGNECLWIRLYIQLLVCCFQVGCDSSGIFQPTAASEWVNVVSDLVC